MINPSASVTTTFVPEHANPAVVLPLHPATRWISCCWRPLRCEPPPLPCREYGPLIPGATGEPTVQAVIIWLTKIPPVSHPVWSSSSWSKMMMLPTLRLVTEERVTCVVPTEYPAVQLAVLLGPPFQLLSVPPIQTSVPLASLHPTVLLKTKSV